MKFIELDFLSRDQHQKKISNWKSKRFLNLFKFREPNKQKQNSIFRYFRISNSKTAKFFEFSLVYIIFWFFSLIVFIAFHKTFRFIKFKKQKIEKDFWFFTIFSNFTIIKFYFWNVARHVRNRIWKIIKFFRQFDEKKYLDPCHDSVYNFYSKCDWKNWYFCFKRFVEKLFQNHECGIFWFQVWRVV